MSGLQKKVGVAALEMRAGELADSGRCSDWVDIADALASEGHLNPAGRLKRSPALLDMLDQRCEQARKQR